MLILIAYVLTFIVGLPANIFTFVTLLGKARRRVNPADILLLNLTIADLLLLLFLPFKMAEAAADMTWPLPIVLCPVANFCFYSSIYLSSLFLAALSVERYLGVVFPLQFKNRRRLGRTMAASAILWLLACSHCSIVFVAQYHGDGSRQSTIYNPNGFMVNGSKTSNGDISIPNGSRISSPSGPKPYNSKVFTNNVTTIPGISTIADVSWTSNIHSTAVPNHLAASSSHGDTNSNSTYKCYDDFSKEQLSFVLPLRLELFLVLFLLPFAVTIFCYINFVRALLARPNIPLEKKQRAVGLAVATMVNFGVCFAPYNISHVVGFVLHESPAWRSYILFLTSLNAALDPFIFYFSSTAIQRAVAGVVVAVRDKLRAMVVCCYGGVTHEHTLPRMWLADTML
ncbi:free fatty acid receptor 3-like [Cygnus atratus]|uniref:free fatty acid receptor 3-like n=1 Tax=Cygnus atratus TaxID=8868 RepID=UPI0021B72699|nr:free fatty acid receptor 3-like [Cygnus atratus]